MHGGRKQLHARRLGPEHVTRLRVHFVEGDRAKRSLNVHPPRQLAGLQPELLFNLLHLVLHIALRGRARQQPCRRQKRWRGWGHAAHNPRLPAPRLGQGNALDALLLLNLLRNALLRLRRPPRRGNRGSERGKGLEPVPPGEAAVTPRTSCPPRLLHPPHSSFPASSSPAAAARAPTWRGARSVPAPAARTSLRGAGPHSTRLVQAGASPWTARGADQRRVRPGPCIGLAPGGERGVPW